MTQGVQTSYEQSMAKAYPGLIADIEDANIIRSKAAEGDIPFGRVVDYGTDAEKQCLLFDGSAGSGHGIGVAVRSLDRENDGSGVAEYKDKTTVGYMQVGYIYAEIDGVGSVGDILTIRTADGKFSTAAIDSTHIQSFCFLKENVVTSGDVTLIQVTFP